MTDSVHPTAGPDPRHPSQLDPTVPPHPASTVETDHEELFALVFEAAWKAPSANISASQAAAVSAAVTLALVARGVDLAPLTCPACDHAPHAPGACSAPCCDASGDEHGHEWCRCTTGARDAFIVAEPDDGPTPAEAHREHAHETTGGE